MTCSVPGCDQPAVLQWQRRATVAEQANYAAYHQAQQQRLVDHARNHLTEAIAGAHSMIEAVERFETDPVRRRHAVESLTREIADLTVRREELSDPTPGPLEDDATVAVFGCGDHALDAAAEEAVQLHAVDCSAVGRCACKGL